MQRQFAFENLDVYKQAVDFVEAVDIAIESARGKCPASRLDQLSRSSRIDLEDAEWIA